MLVAADILIVVSSASHDHGDRVRRYLRDLGYRTEMSANAPYHTTLNVEWDNGIWDLTYNNQAQTFNLRTLKCLERILYEDRILANQGTLPPGRLRPFQIKN